MARRVGLVKVRQYSLEFKLKAVTLSQLKGVEVQEMNTTGPRFLIKPARVRGSVEPRPEFGG